MGVYRPFVSGVVMPCCTHCTMSQPSDRSMPLRHQTRWTASKMISACAPQACRPCSAKAVHPTAACTILRVINLYFQICPNLGERIALANPTSGRSRVYSTPYAGGCRRVPCTGVHRPGARARQVQKFTGPDHFSCHSTAICPCRMHQRAILNCTLRRPIRLCKLNAHPPSARQNLLHAATAIRKLQAARRSSSGSSGKMPAQLILVQIVRHAVRMANKNSAQTCI